MDFLPILSTLRRHRTAATLIVLEIALTCAIVCNAVFVIGTRLGRMDVASGLAEDELLHVQLTGIGKGRDAQAVTREDLAALRATPGVRAAAAVNMVPFGNSTWNSNISTIRDDAASSINAGLYMGGPGLLDTLGVRLEAGRDFTADEYVDYPTLRAGKARLASVIITRGVADRLLPGKNPLGEKLYVWGDEPQIVVGVIERLARPNEIEGPRADYAMVVPVDLSYAEGGNYLLRTDPARRAEVLATIDTTLDRADPHRIVLERRTFAELRHEYFKADRAMAWLLVGVCAALLVITALGIVGLASFWVQQRTRQIGIRRALGATRGDILRYFQTENFILTTLGIGLGMLLAYGINLWAMDASQVPRLPAAILPIGAAALWAIGQLAVLGPALRAAAIPPAIATRSV